MLCYVIPQSARGTRVVSSEPGTVVHQQTDRLVDDLQCVLCAAAQRYDTRPSTVFLMFVFARATVPLIALAVRQPGRLAMHADAGRNVLWLGDYPFYTTQPTADMDQVFERNSARVRAALGAGTCSRNSHSYRAPSATGRDPHPATPSNLARTLSSPYKVAGPVCRFWFCAT